MKAKRARLPPVVSAAELADLIGVSPRSISDLAGRGIVVRAAGRTGYLLRESVRGHADHLRKLATGRGGEGAIAAQTAERARLLRLQGDAQEAKNALQRGALLDAGAVEKEWADMVRVSRAAVLAVPPRCQQRLPHLTAFDISEIDMELREALRGLGEGGTDVSA
jgi:terminase small subunit / prophage DNA-packing protein